MGVFETLPDAQSDQDSKAEDYLEYILLCSPLTHEFLFSSAFLDDHVNIVVPRYGRCHSLFCLLHTSMSIYTPISFSL